MTVRRATAGDGPVLQDLEVRAGRAFLGSAHPEVASDEALPLDRLAGYASDGRSAVAVTSSGAVVGYVLVDRVDDAAHVEQVSVDPDHQGAGIGRALMAWADDWARADGRTAVTLTTFADVAWNAPLYAHLGFRALAPDELGAGLAAVISEEAAHGLDPSTRVAMRKDL